MPPLPSCILAALPSAWHPLQFLPHRPAGWQPPSSGVQAGSRLRRTAPPETAEHFRCGSTTHRFPRTQSSLPDMCSATESFEPCQRCVPAFLLALQRGGLTQGLSAKNPEVHPTNEEAVHHGQQCTDHDPVSAAAALLTLPVQGTVQETLGSAAPKTVWCTRRLSTKPAPLAPFCAAQQV